MTIARGPWSRSRTLLVVVLIAAVALGAGVFAGARITSPADAAARLRPPEASAVTVPIERRTLESSVVARGDASYAGAIDVAPELAGLEATAIVTGKVPAVGDTIDAGDVVIEIAGRPVIALAGDLPMYRMLRPGASGPDVEQLEHALHSLGYDPGVVDGTYTAATGRAVAQLYQDAGYTPPEVDPMFTGAVQAAADALAAAEDELRSWEAMLTQASQGPGDREIIAAQNDVDAARRSLHQAEQDGDPGQIEEARAHLRLMEAALAELSKAPDTTAERAAVEQARRRVNDARGELSDAQAEAGTPLPVSEVVFVGSFPRRVDSVNVARGEPVDGVVASISGADLIVTATVDAATAEFVHEGMEAVIDLPTGEQVTAPITKIEEDQDQGQGHVITITPKDLDTEQEEALRSANLRITISLASTDGDVLAVPLAALTAGPSGEARIEVQRGGDDRNGDVVTELVAVEVGLTANGYAEVTPIDDDASLDEGDLVVVGSDAPIVTGDDD